jgi:putative transposase
MDERGVLRDHATIQRGVVKYSAQLEEAFHRRKRPVGRRWRMDETYIRVKGEWRYLLTFPFVIRSGHPSGRAADGP